MLYVNENRTLILKNCSLLNNSLATWDRYKTERMMRIMR